MFTVESLKDRLVPLTLGDWTRLQQWMKRKPIEDAKLYALGLATEFQSAAMRQALEMARDVSVTSPEGIQILMSPEGCVQLVFETLKRTDAALTVADVAEQIDMQNMIELVKAILEVNGFEQAKNLPMGTLTSST